MDGQQRWLQLMGSSNGRAELDSFYQHCHPGLVGFELQGEGAERVLVTQVRVEEAFLIWRRLVDPLLAKRHLMMPLRIAPADRTNDFGCWAQEDFYRPDLQAKTIAYDAFVFTLDREIAARRLHSTAFREQELWKLLKGMVRGTAEWQAEYPLEPVGSLCPFNVLLDPSGHIRLVCRLSFFNNEYALASEVYSPPESRESSIIKYSLNPSKDPTGIEAAAVYGIGMVLLESATLEVTGVSVLQTVEKVRVLAGSGYSGDLRQVIVDMLGHEQARRPGLQRLLQLARFHRGRHI